MKVKDALAITFSVVLIGACQPSAEKDDLGDLKHFKPVFETQRIQEIKTETLEKREANLAAYTEFKNNWHRLGWERFDLSPNDQDVLACLPNLKAKHSKFYTHISFQTDLIRKARLRNGKKFGLVIANVQRLNSYETKVHTILRLDTCDSIRAASGEDRVSISPNSGNVAHSSISPAEGDDRLLFIRHRDQPPFEAFVNVRKNGIASLARPDISKAILVESQEEIGCLFSVLNRGESAANGMLLTELCPRSRERLQPLSINYQLHYSWFGEDEISAHIARPKSEEEGVEILLPQEAKDVATADYLFQLRLGVSETPLFYEADLSTSDYVWGPFTWHRQAWENQAAKNVP